jgi:hypothetical protein
VLPTFVVLTLKGRLGHRCEVYDVLIAAYFTPNGYYWPFGYLTKFSPMIVCIGDVFYLK